VARKSDSDVANIVHTRGYTTFNHYRIDARSPDTLNRFSGMRTSKGNYAVLMNDKSIIVNMG